MHQEMRSRVKKMKEGKEIGCHKVRFYIAGSEVASLKASYLNDVRKQVEIFGGQSL